MSGESTGTLVPVIGSMNFLDPCSSESRIHSRMEASSYTWPVLVTSTGLSITFCDIGHINSIGSSEYSISPVVF